MVTSKTMIVGGEVEAVGMEERRFEAVCSRWVREGPRRAIAVGWFVVVDWEMRWVAMWVLRGDWGDIPVITMVLGGVVAMVVSWQTGWVGFESKVRCVVSESLPYPLVGARSV